MSIIKVRKLNVTYFLGRPNEVRALSDINLEIYPSEFVVFFGPSGCGKSTLLYTIAGLETNIDGSIYIENKNIAEFSQDELENFHQKKIGMIFQAFYLINSLNVLKNTVLPQIAVNSKTKEREQKALNILKHFGVSEQAGKLPNELSGGQQQRVAICRSIINDPDILFADEPVGNLDSQSASDVMNLLTDLNKKQKKTIVLVTHNPAYINSAHRVFYMKDGRIIKVKVNKPINEKVAISRENEVKTTISKELELLARTFSSINNVGNLLLPFKAKQIVSEVLTEMSTEQVERIEGKVQGLLMGGLISIDEIERFLDDETKAGGLAFDKRKAKKLTNKIKEIVEEIKTLEAEERRISNKHLAVGSEVLQARHYLLDVFDVKLNKVVALESIDRAIRQRLKNEINRDSVQEILDRSVKQGGVGLDRRLARKIAKRLELLILGKLK